MKQGLTFKYYFLRFSPYLLGGGFFLTTFVVWGVGRALGFTSLNSLIAGLGTFLLFSASYVLLLSRGTVRPSLVEHAAVPHVDPKSRKADDTSKEAFLSMRRRLQERYVRVRGSTWRSVFSAGTDIAQPWFLVIGASGAGKSTLLAQAGLYFPYAGHDDEQTAQPRDYDCLLSEEAVWVDTTGRFISDTQANDTWLELLDLLRQQRRRQPLNGLILAVSIRDIMHGSAEEHACRGKRLRVRLQEAQERLATRVPVYLVFTQCDLIPGFTSFYRHSPLSSHDEALGKTFSHAGFEQTDWRVRFSSAMDQLIAQLRQAAARKLSLQDVQTTRQDPAPFCFPLEMAALKPRLELFVDALLRANPYQGAELLRGFYFTSAVDAGLCSASGAYSRQIAQRFSLIGSPSNGTTTGKSRSLFIEGLFRKVIIADRYLVGRYTCNRREHRHKAAWMIGAGVATMLLCSLWGWAWWSNKQSILNISAELAQATAEDWLVEAPQTAWHRLDRLRAWSAHYYAEHHSTGVPVQLRMGLYQGHEVEALLRKRYFAELEQVMLKPTAENLTRTLTVLPTIEVYRRTAKQLGPIIGLDNVEHSALPVDNRPQSLAAFGEAALATYVMLTPAQRETAEPAFLKARIPDYWYPALTRQGSLSTRQEHEFAGRQIDFYSEQIHEADVPRIIDNAFLVSSTRGYIDNLLSESLRSIETITLESDTLFAFGRADFHSLKAEGQSRLSRIAGKLLNTPNLGKVIIAGHADQLGDPQANAQVSTQRAQTIKTYLAGKGVPSERMIAFGQGSDKPLVHCDHLRPRHELIECLGPNRRVEIEVRAVE